LVFRGVSGLFDGEPVHVRYRADLRDTAGNAAHAATSIRGRLIVLDPELKKDAGEHRRILLHEYFHFVWVRLGNPRRLEWEECLAAEWKAGARGEAGWSAEWRKGKLAEADVRGRSRRWREYCCESFCDTAALAYGGGDREVTLAKTRRRARVAWFSASFCERRFPI
jgi:hypothetical protein